MKILLMAIIRQKVGSKYYGFGKKVAKRKNYIVIKIQTTRTGGNIIIDNLTDKEITH